MGRRQARRCLPPASHAGNRGRTQITQTGAIMRYLAGRLDLMPSDLAAAQADEVFEGAHELFSAAEPAGTTPATSLPPHARPVFPSFMPVSPISNCCWRHGGPFFLGSNACYCDFGAFHHIDLAHFMDEAILKDYPRLRDFMAAMHGLPGLATYLAERPELTDVGVGPKLVIDGRPVPTGVIAD